MAIDIFLGRSIVLANAEKGSCSIELSPRSHNILIDMSVIQDGGKEEVVVFIAYFYHTYVDYIS